ncbi:hypothetical protein R1sor_023469 [Riccia sorocarpa]|uniref:Thioredoxin domain-containing protein n=1 Tax=Riccia sorocarpa TaxID=122646 RepID=A0ABD3GNI2_9MARC
MAAAGVSYLRLDSSLVAGFSTEGGLSCKINRNEAETVRINRNVLVQSSVVLECGGSKMSVISSSSSRIGLKEVSGLNFGRTDGEQSVMGVGRRVNAGRITSVAAVAPQADFEARPEPKMSAIPLELISNEGDFDLILSQAQQRNEPIVIEWMASWCRKCLYLKPKLEKLAAAFYPGIKFYYVDVNKVPQSMVKRAQVTQMPTIQVWKNSQQEAQVIGGHEASRVVDLVKDMVAKSFEELRCSWLLTETLNVLGGQRRPFVGKQVIRSHESRIELKFNSILVRMRLDCSQ